MDFNEGDKVRISASHVDEFAVTLKDNDIGENERERKKLARCEHVVYDTDPGADEDVCIRVNGVDGNEAWVNSSWLETSPFNPLTEPLKPGDKVMVAKTNSSLFGLPGTVKKVEGEGPKALVDVEVQGRAGKDDGFFRSNVLLLEQRDEDGWDPMTEPLQVGDLVEVVYPNHEHTGKRGRITAITNGCYDVDGGMSVSEIGPHGAKDGKGRWRGREHLKLLSKAGTAVVVEAPKVVSAEAKPEIKKGDTVRILDTTRELQEKGYPVLFAAMMSRREGKVQDVGKDPLRYLVSTSKGQLVADKVEKLNP